MAKIVELPDGREAEFPDDMSNDAIGAVLSKQFGSPAAAPQQAAAPAPYQPYQNATDIGSDTERFGENPGTGKGGAEFHQGIASTPARLVKSIAQMAGQDQRLPEVVNKSAQVADTGFGTAGRIVGDVAATAFPVSKVGQMSQGFSLPTRLGIAAGENAAYNAALSPDQQQEAALYGAALGPLGHLAGSAASGIVRPTPEARVLMDKGVVLTPGQASGTGSFTKKAEEYLGTLPIASHFIKGAQNRAVEDANVAAVQTVRNMVGEGTRLGRPPREAIEQTREAISKTYDEALAGMKVPGFVPEAALGKVYLNLAKDFPMLEKSQVDQMGRFVNGRLSQMIENAKVSTGKAELTGEMLKQLDSEIGGFIRSFRASPNTADKLAAPAWSELQQGLREVMADAHPFPAQKDRLKAANAAYRELLTLEKAMLPGNDVFTPRRLKMTIERMNNNKMPDTELGKVSQAMSATLPNQVPSSGTAERLLISGTIPAILGLGGAGAQGMGYGELGAGMMAAGALGSRKGAQFLTGSMPGQQAFVEALRRFIPRAKPGQGNERE